MFVARFLEHIPHMDMHLSIMLDCKKCKWFLLECNISCSLLTTVTSNKWQYLHQYWLFLWCFFWYVPIRHIGRHLECQSTNRMYQSTTNEIGVLTVCNSEQPYLHQNTLTLWHVLYYALLSINNMTSAIQSSTDQAGSTGGPVPGQSEPVHCQ